MSIHLSETQLQEELSCAYDENQHLETRLAMITEEVLILSGMIGDRDHLVSSQQKHIEKLEGLVATSHGHMDEMYVYIYI